MKYVRNLINSWSLLTFIFIALILIPNLFVVIGFFDESNSNWEHVKRFLLKDYIFNSTLLIIFTGIFSLLIGLSLAWLIAVFDFPFRFFFQWSLALPLAIPPYIGGFSYVGLLNYTGPVQSLLRNYLGLKVNPSYFDIMNLGGAIFIYTIFLYPYVYLISKSFLEKQSSSLIEVSRTLGRGPLKTFFYIILPISRASVVGGVSLVVLEVINDYGVVKYFGIPTFSTSIFKTWFALGDLDSAVKLSASLMLIVFVLLVLEKISRGNMSFSYSTTRIRPMNRIKLKGLKGFLATMFSLVIFSIGFLIPVANLIYWSGLSYQRMVKKDYLNYIQNTLGVALLSSFLIIIIAIVIANTVRINKKLLVDIGSKIVMLGYSIPGAVIAVGVLLFFLKIDALIQWLSGDSKELILTTSLLMLIFAYIIRFLAIGYNSVENGFNKVGKNFFEASRILGCNITKTFIKVDLPMIKPAITSGILLVFVEVVKELPLTLILRPFNFDTLATKAFEYANDEMIHEAAVSSLLLIALCTILIYLLLFKNKKEGANSVYRNK